MITYYSYFTHRADISSIKCTMYGLRIYYPIVFQLCLPSPILTFIFSTCDLSPLHTQQSVMHHTKLLYSFHWGDLKTVACHMRWWVMLRGWHGSLCISCQPSIKTHLKSQSTAIIWDWLTSGQVEPAINDLQSIGPVVFFSCQTAMDMVSKHATEHAATELCTISFWEK